MIAHWIVAMGPWSWLVIGAILLVAEILNPGIFLIWIGIAAVAVGLLSLALWDSAWWVWEIQLLLFAVFSVIAVLAGRRYFVSRGQESDEPNLNNRGESLVGRTATLREPVTEGRGRIHIDDTVWIIEGPDLEAGSRVRVTAAHGRVLKVEKA